MTYSIRAGDDASRALTLRADTDADVRKIYWFVDASYLGSSAAHESFEWSPKLGSHTILALDDAGRSSTCAVTVESSDVN